MNEDEFLKLKSGTLVLFKEDLADVFDDMSENPTSKNDAYHAFLAQLQGTIRKVNKSWGERILKELFTTEYEVDQGWNIYRLYIDRIITKEEYPEYFL